MADTKERNGNSKKQKKKSVQELRQMFEKQTESPLSPLTPSSEKGKSKPRPLPKPYIYGTKALSVRDVSDQGNVSSDIQSEAREIPEMMRNDRADSHLSKEDGLPRVVIDEEDTKASAQPAATQQPIPSIYQAKRHSNVDNKNDSSPSPNGNEMEQQTTEDAKQVLLDDEKAKQDIHSDKSVRKKKSLRRSVRSGPNVKQIGKQYERKSPSSAIDMDDATKDHEGETLKPVMRNRKSRKTFIRRMEKNPEHYETKSPSSAVNVDDTTKGGEDDTTKPVQRSRKLRKSLVRRIETNLSKQDENNVPSSNKGSDVMEQASNDLGSVQENEHETTDVISERLGGLEQYEKMSPYSARDADGATKGGGDDTTKPVQRSRKLRKSLIRRVEISLYNPEEDYEPIYIKGSAAMGQI